MSNQVELPAAREALPNTAAQRPPRQRLSWGQRAILIAFILCAAGLLAAVAEVARAQFHKGLSFSFANAIEVPAPAPYVSRGGADVRELAPTLQAIGPLSTDFGR